MSFPESPVKKRRKEKEDDVPRQCVIHIANVEPQEAVAKFSEKAWLVSRSSTII